VSGETSKAIIRRYREIYNRSQLDKLAKVLDPNFVAHNLAPGLPAGLEGARTAHQAALASFPDQQVSTEDLIAEGDQVVERWTLRGTHTGAPFFVGNIPADGKRIETTGISIYRLANGRIVEHWGEFDFVRILQQLGAMPAP
jgi:predicted ester cyclase